MPARRAGPKSGDKLPINLVGCPDPLVDLLAARLWVMENVLHVQLRGWQMKLMEELGGNKRPRVSYVQIPRKNGKSFVLAVFVLTELILLDERHCFGVSDSERNLASVLFREIETLVYKNNLEDSIHLYASKIENPHNLSFFELCPANYQASQGKNPHLVVADEIHLMADDRLWNGMQMAGAARKDALLLGVTTPGYDHVGLAHHLYMLVKAGKMHGMIYEPDPELGQEFDYTDRDIWAACNPSSYSEDGFLDIMAMDLELLPEHEFRRFRLGQWTSAANAWLPYGALKSRLCTSDFDYTQRVWLGFDGSHSGDSTAIVMVNALGQTKLVGHWENPTLVMAGTAVDKDWRVPRGEVMDTIHTLFNTYEVVQLVADPAYWARELYELGKEYRGRVREFPAGVPVRMAPAVTALYTAIMDGGFSYVDSPDLERHFANTVTRPTPFGDTIAKAQQWSPKKMDIAIATSLAYHAMASARVRHPAGAR